MKRKIESSVALHENATAKKVSANILMFLGFELCTWQHTWVENLR